MQQRRLGLVLCVFAGCTGLISSPPDSLSTDHSTDTPARPVASVTSAPPAVCDRQNRRVAPLGTRLIRLTHRQYDNTVRDLLGVDVALSIGFQKDPTFQGFD